MKMKRIALLLLLAVATNVQASGPAFARFVPERNDDFAWENDKVAFRVYGPHYRGGPVNNGIDCWLKRVDYPIINKWYAQHDEGISYHEDHGEGYDPYKVGASRGCGGSGLWIDGEIIHSDTFVSWEILRSDGDTVSFVLSYEWTHAGDQYEEQKQITLRAGERLFESQSVFKKNGEIAAGLPIAVGLATHGGKATAMANTRKGWIACWETIDGYGLGTAVVMDPERIKRFELIESGETVDGHALLITETDADGQIEYAAGYGWEKAEEITSPDAWMQYLE